MRIAADLNSDLHLTEAPEGCFKYAFTPGHENAGWSTSRSSTRLRPITSCSTARLRGGRSSHRTGERGVPDVEIL
jgi:hypothetical protein